jgi:hypothetical protein
VEAMGYIFGMFGFTFGLIAFISASNAASSAAEASGKIERLETRLYDAGLLNRETTDEDA